MNDSVKTFIELGQRVDTIGILTDEKKVNEAKSLKEWTQTDLVLMKEDLVEYLRNILSGIRINVDIPQHAEREMIFPEGSKVKDLYNRINSDFKLGDSSEIETIKATSIDLNTFQEIKMDNDLIEGKTYLVIFKVYLINLLIRDRNNINHRMLKNIIQITTIKEFRESLITHAVRFYNATDTDTYTLYVGLEIWGNSDEYFHAKWVSKGSPPVRLLVY